MVTSDELLLTAVEFLDFFTKDSWFRTSDKFDASQGARATMLFRGQSDANWGLKSSAFRPGEPFHDFTPQPPYLGFESRRRTLGHHLHAEARAVFLFLDSADRLGFSTPIDFTTLNDSNDLMYAAMNDQEYDYTESFPSMKYETSVALAQHHGVPTRFLDWSESPLIACYFAAIGASTLAPKEPRENQEIAVYFFASRSFTKDDSPIALIKVPKFQNTNLRAQQGTFTNIREANSYFLEHGSWPDLLDLADGNFQIQKRRLPASESNELLRLLYDLDITRERLIPNLDNSALSYQYRRALFERK